MKKKIKVTRSSGNVFADIGIPNAAEHSIKADLVLESVARSEGLEVTAEELGEEIGQLAVALGRDAKELARTLDRNGQVVALAGDIIRSKALDVLVENAEIVWTDAAPSPSEASSPEDT